MSSSPIPWRKSTRSGSSGADCVEVAAASGAAGAASKAGEPVVILVRDSKNPGAAPLTFTTAEWDAFVGGVKAGELDLATLIDPVAATAT